MNTNSKLAAGVLVGILIGVTVARALHAEQTKMPPAYLIAEVEKDPGKPVDPAAAKKYADEFFANFAKALSPGAGAPAGAHVASDA